MLYKSVNESFNEFIIDRQDAKCIRCKVCIRQCSYDVHTYVDADDTLAEENSSCIGCRRCSALCPTGAITIRANEETFKKNESWSGAHIRNLYAQADSGGILLAANGNRARPARAAKARAAARQSTATAMPPGTSMK